MPLAALAAFIDIVMRFQRLPSRAPVVGLRLDMWHAKTRTSTSCMDLWGHGDLHQFDHYFIYIRKFFADNFVQYGPSLPKINQLEFASSLSHSAIIVQGSALRAAIGQLLQQTLSSRRAHIDAHTKFLNARTLATQVCPIQFSNRPDVR